MSKFKQIISIAESPWDSNDYQVFFDDDTFSDFSKANKTFYTHSNLAEWGKGKWPRNSDGSFKKLAATMDSNWDSNFMLYFFDDGTAAGFYKDKKNWSIAPTPLEGLLQAWDLNGWPQYANGRFKQVTAITTNEWASTEKHFFFDDLTICNYEKARLFIDPKNSRSLKLWSNDNWPKNPNSTYKKVVGTMMDFQNANTKFYFFNDGTAADLTISTKQWNIAPLKIEQLLWSFFKWPLKSLPVPFDSTIHEIVSIQVRPHTSNLIYEIIADGKDQAPIHVWVLIRDKTTGKSVELSDDGTAVNGGERFSLVTLYDYWLGPRPRVRSFLDIDKLGTSDFSLKWEVSRRKTVKPSVTNVTPSTPNNQQDEISNRGFIDGWNRYTYYVTSIEPEKEKKICARVGAYPDYVYSSRSPLDEYVRIKAFPVPDL